MEHGSNTDFQFQDIVRKTNNSNLRAAHGFFRHRNITLAADDDCGRFDVNESYEMELRDLLQPLIRAKTEGTTNESNDSNDNPFLIRVIRVIRGHPYWFSAAADRPGWVESVAKLCLSLSECYTK